MRFNQERFVGVQAISRRRPSPSPDPVVRLRGQVRARSCRRRSRCCTREVAGSAVQAVLQEPGPPLARLDVPVQLVLGQLVGGEQVPDPGLAGLGGAHPPPRRPAGSLPLPLPRPTGGRAGLQVRVARLVHADTTTGSPCSGATLRSAIAYRCSIRLAGSAGNTGGLKRSPAQVTGPADAAAQIDQLRAGRIVLTYDPDDRTLRASGDAPSVTIGRDATDVRPRRNKENKERRTA